MIGRKRNQFFKNIEGLRNQGVSIQYTQEQLDELLKCRNDPIYFCNKYVKIRSLDHEDSVPFATYDYQDRILNAIHENQKVVLMMARQMGKSLVMSAYILHQVLFKSKYHVITLGYDLKSAKNNLSLVKSMYEELPYWMQQGVSKWSESSIILENGSTVSAAATTRSGIRGRTCVTGDTLVRITDGNEIRDVRIDSLIGVDCSGFKIMTEKGFRNFKEVIDQGISESLLKITFDDSTIRVTPDHRFLMIDNEWKEARFIAEGDIFHSGRVAISKEVVPNERVFDIFDVEETNSYYSNGVISHNCNLIYLDELGFVESGVAQEFLASSYPVIFTGKKAKILISSTPLGMNHFYHLWKDAEAGKNGFLPIKVHYTENPNRDEAWAKEQLKLLGSRAFNQEVLCSFLGSAYTLISGDALQSLSSIDPIKEKGSLTIYEHPVPDHTYTVTVDTAEGIQQDRSAFSVIDITQRPYKIVARYYNDSISYLLFPDVIRQVAYDYNQAYVLVETNSVGNQVAVILMNDLEYDNVLRFISEPKKGQILSRDARAKYGIVMSSKVKSIGCRALKTLIEEDMLIINDAEIINELNNFVEVGATYKAADGYHDDLVMTLVSFAYLTQDKRFLDFTDTSRHIEFKHQIERLSDEVKIPVTFYFDNGEETEIEDDDELVGF